MFGIVSVQVSVPDEVETTPVCHGGIRADRVIVHTGLCHDDETT